MARRESLRDPRFDSGLEPVRKDHLLEQSFRSMRRMEARRRNARPLRVRFSKSLAKRRQRLSHAKVRSTTHGFGKTSKPLARSDLFTISVARCGRAFFWALQNCGP